MKTSTAVIPSLLAFLFCLVLSGRSLSVAGEKPPLVLEGAEYVRQKLENGETVIILEGNVRWSRGDSRLRCDRAKYIEARELLFLSRDVRLVDENRRVRADSILYISEREYAVAMGNVMMETAGGDIIVRSDSIDYDLGESESWAFKRPQLILRKEESGDDHTGDVLILGDYLHMLEGDYLAIAGGVDISGDSLVGGADSLNYDMTTDRIVLRGTPWVEVGSYRLTGETLELRVPGRRLRRGISRGNARGEQGKKVGGTVVMNGGEASGGGRGDDLTNWIEGDSIFISFRDNRIDSLRALPSARSYYRVNRGGGVEENYVVGDEILLMWEDSQLDLIKVTGRGEGVYLKSEGADSMRGREESAEEYPDEEVE